MTILLFVIITLQNFYTIKNEINQTQKQLKRVRRESSSDSK